MLSKKTVRKPLVIKNNKTQLSFCAKARKSCTNLQAELADIGRHGTIPKTELNQLSKRVRKIDRTASIVLAALK